MAAMACSTAAPVCSSIRAASSQARRPAPKQVALPKQLGGFGAALLANGAAALAAAAEPAPFGGAGAQLSAAASSLPSLPAVDMPDVAGLLDGVDPLLLAGGAAVVAVPLGLIALLGGGDKAPKAKAVPAEVALQALQADETCLLLDIRSKAQAKAEGTPSLKGVSRRGPIAVPFTSVVKGEVVVDEAFAAKAVKASGLEAGGSPLILLDGEGDEAAAASSALLAEVPGAKIFYITGGAEAWREAGAPWKEPFTLALPELSLEGLNNSINSIAGGVKELADDFQEAPTLTKGLLTAGAVVGASVLLFSQVELLLEVAGVVGAGQFFLKLLFADDREKTFTKLKQVAEEVAIPELPQDLSKIATTLLEDSGSTQVKRVEEAAPAAAASPAAEARAWIDNWRAKQGVSA